MDCATMRSEVMGDFQEPYGAILGINSPKVGDLCCSLRAASATYSVDTYGVEIRPLLVATIQRLPQ